MDRARHRYRCHLILLLSLSAALVPLAGCTTLATLAYVIRGTNVEAEYSGLKGKRVAVVCRPTGSLQYSRATVAKDLARRVSTLIGENVRKTTMIDPAKIDEWMDEHTWDDYVEIGEALDADVVVAIDLEQFSLFQGQTLYQGKAVVEVTVYDIQDGGKAVYSKSPPQMLYPPNIGIPTSDKLEAQFRNEFLNNAANEIARYFYAHDTRIDFAKDTQAFQ